MSVLKKWIEAFRSPDRNDDAQSASPPAESVDPELDRAFDDVLDDVMTRFGEALEHLAK